MSYTQRLWLSFGPAALAVGVLAILLVLASDHDKHPVPSAIFLVLAGFSFIGAGLVAWSRRPSNNTGRLMVAVGFVWFVNVLPEANDAWAFTAGLVLQAVFIAVFVHLLVAFPSGTLTRGERMLVLVTYAVATLANLASLPVTKTPIPDCPHCPPNELLVASHHTLQTGIEDFWNAVGIAIVIAVLVILLRRRRAATPAARRVLDPVFISGCTTLVLLGLMFALQTASTGVSDFVGFFAQIAFVSVPFFFLAGLMRSRLARADVGRIFVEVPDEPSTGEVTDAFRRALRDPTLRLAHWLEDRQTYVDLEGHAFERPEADRELTPIEYGGRRVGAIVHDPSLHEEPEILEAGVAAAGIALERRRLQDELRARIFELEASEARNRALLDAVPDPMFRFRRDGTYLDYHVHDPAELVHPEVIGLTVRDRLPGPVADKLLAAAARALDEGGIQADEAEFEARGEQRAYEVRVVASGDDEVVAITRDVTQRVRQQRELQESEQRSRALLDALPDLMFRIQRDGTYLDYHAHDVSQLVRPEVIGLKLHDRLPREIADEILAATQRALDDGGVQTVEGTLDLHGEKQDFEMRIVASGPDEVVAVDRDITLRKAQERALRESEQRSRALLTAIPDNMFRIRRDGVYVDFHVSDPTMLVMDHDAIIGSHVREQPRVPEWLVKAVSDTVDRALDTGELQTLEYHLAGTDREARIIPSGNDEVFMIVRNVTERKQQEEELRRSRARLVEAADAERRRLERNLHDGAQQRLVSLSLALRLAQARLHTDDASAAEELLTGAQEELAQALEELRELARGIHPAILTDRGLTAALETLAARSPLPVEVVRVPDERLPGPVEAAAYYVVAEGLTNVVKYADASLVQVSIERRNGVAWVEVVDDGKGGADPAVGTGLRGLSDRVEALDGRLVVESPAGGGTILRAEIPVA